jgi:hypothetical protein
VSSEDLKKARQKAWIAGLELLAVVGPCIWLFYSIFHHPIPSKPSGWSHLTFRNALEQTGYDAYWEGKTDWENPYDSSADPVRHEHWHTGWQKGLDQKVVQDVEQESNSVSTIQSETFVSPTPGKASVHSEAPTEPVPTPVPATALSTPRGFNGEVTGIKLFLNQTPEVWIKYYGNNGTRENAGFEHTWYVGRFKLHVSFDRKSQKADSVALLAQPCKPVLTLDEAKKAVASLGLKNFQPTYDTNGGSWGHDDEAIYARYFSSGSGNPWLSIQTSLYNQSFIGD